MSKPGKASVVLGILAAGLIGGFLAERVHLSEVAAQDAAAKAIADVPRFQVSAYGDAQPGRFGAFIIDTRTGQIWTVDSDGRTSKRGQIHD